VTIGGLNQVKVFRTDNFEEVATIPVGELPHGIWPSGDGTRLYVGLENADAVAAIDTATNTVIANVPVGQAPQALAYVPNAVPEGDGRQGLQALGVAGQSASLTLVPVAGAKSTARTSVTLFDQGLIQVVQAAVTGLAPKEPHMLALAERPDGSGPLQPLATFMSNPAGAAIVNALGPIRQLVHADSAASRRYLVVAPVVDGQPGKPVQVQAKTD
jgi:YVTN family beta-propeller protein